MRPLLALLLLTGAAVAQPTPGATPLTVEVGQRVEREVGIAIGAQCDDPTIVRATMVTRREDMNVFVATGLRPGTTLCRAGTDPNRFSVVYEVTVVPARAKR